MTEPWYQSGLRFKCEGLECGDCCSGRWGPGYVWVEAQEMQALATKLGLDFDAFTHQYVRQVGKRYSLREKANHDCVFYVENKGCSVYEARPKQCQSYPFWPSVVKDQETWDREAEDCPGINQGSLPEDLHKAEEVERLRALHE